MSEDTASPVSEYHMKLLQKRYGMEYKITQSSLSLASSSSTNTNREYSYILKAKDNPSLLIATLFPMYKTRYKYKITFHHVHVGGVVGGEGDGSKQEEKEIRVSYQDLYLITFNRTNGSTPEQQMRIYNRTKAFEEQLEKLIEEIRYDKEMIIQKNKKKKKNDDKEWEISENG